MIELDDVTYDDSRPCAKCGSTATATRFIDGNVSHDLRTAQQAGKLKRWCERCGYVWYERPLDDKDDE